MDKIEPFHLAVPEADLDDLRERLARTRWPDRETVDDVSQGPPLGKVQDLCSYWLHDYDWRRCESALNALGQHTTEIDGLGIHFLHVRSPEPDAFPLLMTHGWPGSVLEFHRVVGLLTDPAAHGGDPADAFDLVIPSLPGFGYSEKPTASGWNIARIAAAWGTLMQRLGYERWGAQGGDWGALVTEQLGRDASPGCVGLHFNFTLFALTPEELARPSPVEQRVLADAARFFDEQSSYLKMQTSSPQTLGYSLCDSPTGLAAWIYAMYQDFTDNEDGPESLLGLDTMLDQIMMFWLTNTSASSFRLNWEAARERASAAPTATPITVPAGFSMFPKEVLRTSRRWAEARFTDVIHFHELERGGHFAALEQPEVFADEVRQTFRSVRKGGQA
jgi:pimeloyl-ACP methyl ester carboxylesterase